MLLPTIDTTIISVKQNVQMTESRLQGSSTNLKKMKTRLLKVGSKSISVVSFLDFIELLWLQRGRVVVYICYVLNNLIRKGNLDSISMKLQQTFHHYLVKL